MAKPGDFCLRHRLQTRHGHFPSLPSLRQHNSFQLILVMSDSAPEDSCADGYDFCDDDNWSDTPGAPTKEATQMLFPSAVRKTPADHAFEALSKAGVSLRLPSVSDLSLEEVSTEDRAAFATWMSKVERSFEAVKTVSKAAADMELVLDYGIFDRTEHEAATKAKMFDELKEAGRLFKVFEEDEEKDGAFKWPSGSECPGVFRSTRDTQLRVLRKYRDGTVWQWRDVTRRWAKELGCEKLVYEKPTFSKLAFRI